jgi:hypothetical protein
MIDESTPKMAGILRTFRHHVIADWIFWIF